MAFVIIAIVFIIAIAIVPQFWVQSVIARHSQPRADFPGTGGEFARHLLDHWRPGDPIVCCGILQPASPSSPGTMTLSSWRRLAPLVLFNSSTLCVAIRGAG